MPSSNGSSRGHSSSSELFALVRWVTGVQAGSYTPNLNVKWIRDFNPEEYDPSDSYTVEWRKPPKPRTGWVLLDCVVLEVSADLDFLKSKMASFERDPDTETQEQETPVRFRRSGSESDPQYLREILNTLSTSLVQRMPPQGQGPIGQGYSSGSFSSSTDDSQNVKKVGAALTISNTAYIAAKAASSPSRMTITLVRAAFSKRRLRRSSYAGQKRHGSVKPGLKRYRKMQDIQDFVKSRFPYITQAAFGAAVNSCVGKNVDKEKVLQESRVSSWHDTVSFLVYYFNFVFVYLQLCDESESDEEQ